MLAPSRTAGMLGCPMRDEHAGRTAETRACTFVMDARGFVRATMRDGIEMTLTDAEEALAATAEVAGHVRARILVDSRGLRYQTKEARDHFVSADAERVSLRVALLVGSPVSRMIGNFFLRRQAHRAPTRLFSDEADAIEWLLSERP